MERVALTVFPLRQLVLEDALERLIRSLFGTLFTTEGANRRAGFREKEKLTNMRSNGY